MQGHRHDGISWRSALDDGLTLAVLALLAAMCVLRDAHHIGLTTGTPGAWGSDFHFGLWPAAAAMLRGASPYPPANLHALIHMLQPFFWPPLMAVLVMPLAHLPFGVAIGLWNGVCLASFAGGLWIFGLRDWRIYALALMSFPFQESLYWGQAEGIHMLLLALAWRYRDSWQGGVALGAVIAAKLVAWPLLFWLIVTRRYSAARSAVLATAFLLLGSWALIGFHGMLSYPHLLSLDALLYQHSTLSASAIDLFARAGMPPDIAALGTLALAIGVGAAAVTRSRGSESGWFAAAILASLLWSPLMWTHYLVIVLAPLCVTRGRSVRVWMLTLGFWVWPFVHSYDVRAAATLLTAVALTLVAARPPELDVAPDEGQNAPLPSRLRLSPDQAV